MSSRPRRQALRSTGRTPAGRLSRVTRIGFPCIRPPLPPARSVSDPSARGQECRRHLDRQRRDKAGRRRIRHSFRGPSGHAPCAPSRISRSGAAPDPVAKALAVRTSSPDVLLDLGVPTSVNACSESTDTDLAARIRQDLIRHIQGENGCQKRSRAKPATCREPRSGRHAPVGTERPHAPWRRPRMHGTEPCRGRHLSGG